MNKQRKRSILQNIITIIVSIVFITIVALYTVIFIAFTGNEHSTFKYAILIGIAMIEVSIIPILIVNLLRRKTNILKRILKLETVIFLVSFIEAILIKIIFM